MDTVNTIKFNAFSEVASSVIHEMKNPLSAITLGIEYLQLSEAGAANAETMTNISLAVVRLNEMLENLRLFFMDENGAGKKSPIKISDLLKKAKKLINYYLAKNHVRLEIEESGREPWVTVNEGQIMTAFFLTIVWAIKKINGVGTLKCRCESSEEGLRVDIEVQGNGDTPTPQLRPADDRQMADAVSKLIAANGGQVVFPEAGDVMTGPYFRFLAADPFLKSS